MHKGHRYYLINKKIPNTIMAETKDICKILGKMILDNIVDPSSIEIFQEYSTHNI